MQLKTKKNSKWNERFVIRAYEMARDGMTESTMAKVLGVAKVTFNKWESDHPLFAYALREGRRWYKRGVKPYADWMDDINSQLPADLQELWQKIHQFNLAPGGIAKIEALLAGRGKLIRQKLFIAALVKSNFNVSAACRMTATNRGTFERWVREPEFQRLIKHVEQIEREWSQSCLRRLVQMGDFQANKLHLQVIDKEGYGAIGTNVRVNVSGQIEHTHTLVLMEDLDLPINVQKIILAKCRERKQIESQTVESKSA